MRRTLLAPLTLALLMVAASAEAQTLKIGYINSTAIAFLVQKMKKIQRRGGAFALCNLSAYNNTVMKLTGASKRMPIFPGESDAVKALVAKQ